MPRDFDPLQNFTHQPDSAISNFFTPKSIAVIGATDKPGVGRTLLENLKSFNGAIYPINPKRDVIFGMKCYPSILDLPHPVDLAIIVTKANTVLEVVKQCVAAKIPAALIISAGFKELGEEGLKAEQELIRVAKAGNMRIIGPNCLGVMNPLIRLNATFAADSARPGQIAFISQSGAMCTAVLDWSLREDIGFSSFISIGSMADVNFGDLISYLGNDPATNSILIYMETIGDAKAFLSAAREVAFTKPIIVIKAGKTDAAASAAASHTGSLTGSDAVFNIAMEEVGVLRVDRVEELFDLALVLSKQPKPTGPKLTIITNAGGPAVLATDATIMAGAEMATVPKEVVEELNAFLPEAWSHANPIDLLGDALPDTYAKTTKLIAEKNFSDGILLILSPQAMTNPSETARLVAQAAENSKMPILASWMGGTSVEEGTRILNRAGVPTFAYPDDACKTFGRLWQYTSLLNALYRTPSSNLENDLVKAKEESKKIISKALDEGRDLLTEEESKRILKLYGIPTVETHIATSSKDAAAAAKSVGFPVVVKLHSETITHKSDVGGVILNLLSEEAVENAFHTIKTSVENLKGSGHFLGVTVQKMIKQNGYDLILGSSVDPQFGPVLLFGTGGVLVEIYKDSALALPPLNSTRAKRLMQKTKIYHALQGVRGEKAVDLEKLTQLLIAFSQLIADHPNIKECDINPLRVSSELLIALDGRFLLQKEKTQLVIRPYPSHYISNGTLKNGKALTFRPIKPEDEPKLIAFHQQLSLSSVKQRYLEALSFEQRTAHNALVRVCYVDYAISLPIIAEYEGAIIAVARLTKIALTDEADLKMVVVDAFQNQGVGKQLLTLVIEMAKKEKIKAIKALMHNDNEGMLKLCKAAGFFQQEKSEKLSLLRLDLQ